MNLVQSNVVFDQEKHTYTLGTFELCGVTPIVSWMFDETYDGIPESVLNKAAERGSFIHEQIELTNELGIYPESCPEAIEYIRLVTENKLTHVASEYLVSDESYIASSIDIVFEGNILADIKCTSKIHIPNVTLQLSIYAYLFELQNPTQKAGRLLVIWLPREQYGKPKIIEVERIPTDTIKKIIMAYGDGKDPAPFRACLTENVSEDNSMPAEVKDVQRKLITFERQLKSIKEQEDKLKSGLLELMKQHGVKKWETDELIMTYVAPTTRETFDGKKFKSDYSDLYEKYKGVSNVKETIKIKVK